VPAHLCTVLIVFLIGAAVPAAAAQDGAGTAPPPAKTPPPPEASAADEVLRGKGLERKGTRYLLPGEAPLARKNRDVNGLRRAIKDAEKAMDKFTDQRETLEREIDSLMAQRRQISDRLPSLQSDVDRYNEAVTRMNQITYRLDDLMRERQVGYDERKVDIEKQERAAHEALVLHAVEMRRDADDLSRRYAALAADAEVTEALATLSRIESRDIVLGPSSRFEGTVRAIARLERQFDTATIPLRRQGNSHWVTVTLNGRTPKEFVFDTGADSVVLPSKMAAEIGLRPGPSTQPIRVTVADGRTIDAYQMTIPSVSIREFEVKDVHCVVLPASMENAAPLLGGSFLNHFIYRVDTGSSQLVLHRRNEPRTGSRRRP
jgi:clan AA aspartic protease (TIGR02281 family)